MSTTIPNNGLPKFTPVPSSGPGASHAPSSTNTAASGTVASATGDQLNLTDSARSLQDAARSAPTDAVDQQRVEAIRLALANGTYKADPGRIADRMIALELQIGGKGKA